jgi:hypothetical protein
MADRINQKLSEWKEKYERSLSTYSEERENFRLWQAQFDGDKKIPGGKDATSAYNFTRELIEAQIDSNLPQPAVSPRKASQRNRELADIIVTAIRNELDRLPSEMQNDLDERLSRIMGGTVYLTEWDNTQKTHRTVGELSNRLVSPLEFIPQEAVFDAAKMDYFFLAFEETKERIKAKYGKDVENESIDGVVSDREFQEAEDLVTQIVCFYREKADIACISWAGDTLLMDEDNYFARKDKVCARCFKTQGHGETQCSCGSSQWERRDRAFETLTHDMVRSDGSIIPALSPKREGGELVFEEYEEPLHDPETGAQLFHRVIQNGLVVGEEPVMQTKTRPVMEPTRLPYYRPNDFPIAVRRNMSVYQKFFGESDCKVLREEQIQANKAMTKIDRKIRKTSEFFTKPRDLNFKFSNDNDDMGVLNVDAPAQMGMIKALSLQFDMMAEYSVIERAYYQAKSLLAVSDTFQGKADPTAQSGKAKEIQVAQAAGIQRSKRVMKNAAYADLFRNMFWFLLAFADEPRTYTTMDANGQQVEKVFSRYDFLEQDEWGNWYYNDEFIFSVDEAGAMQTDKRYLLEDVRTDFNMGAFGNPTDPETILMYWKEKEVLSYPNAKRMVKYWQDKLQKAQQRNEQVSQLPTETMQVPMKGGMRVALPNLQHGTADYSH